MTPNVSGNRKEVSTNVSHKARVQKATTNGILGSSQIWVPFNKDRRSLDVKSALGEPHPKITRTFVWQAPRWHSYLHSDLPVPVFQLAIAVTHSALEEKPFHSLRERAL